MHGLMMEGRREPALYSTRCVFQFTPTPFRREIDGSGLVSRQENDRTPGMANYFLTLEGKW